MPARCWVLRDRAGFSFRGGVVLIPCGPFFCCRLAVGVRDRPYFENYTVDASILKKTEPDLFLDPVHLM